MDRREEALTRHLERSGRADCIGAPCEAACDEVRLRDLATLGSCLECIKSHPVPRAGWLPPNETATSAVGTQRRGIGRHTNIRQGARAPPTAHGQRSSYAVQGAMR